MTEPMLTVRQLCERLQVSRPRIQEMRRRGMPCVRVGTGGPRAALRFDWEQVKAWLEAETEKVA